LAPRGPFRSPQHPPVPPPPWRISFFFVSLGGPPPPPPHLGGSKISRLKPKTAEKKPHRMAAPPPPPPWEPCRPPAHPLLFLAPPPRAPPPPLSPPGTAKIYPAALRGLPPFNPPRFNRPPPRGVQSESPAFFFSPPPLGRSPYAGDRPTGAAPPRLVPFFLFPRHAQTKIPSGPPPRGGAGGENWNGPGRFWAFSPKGKNKPTKRARAPPGGLSNRLPGPRKIHPRRKSHERNPGKLPRPDPSLIRSRRSGRSILFPPPRGKTAPAPPPPGLPARP